jgi:hypothetical protein
VAKSLREGCRLRTIGLPRGTHAAARGCIWSGEHDAGDTAPAAAVAMRSWCCTSANSSSSEVSSSLAAAVEDGDPHPYPCRSGDATCRGGVCGSARMPRRGEQCIGREVTDLCAPRETKNQGVQCERLSCHRRILQRRVRQGKWRIAQTAPALFPNLPTLIVRALSSLYSLPVERQSLPPLSAHLNRVRGCADGIASGPRLSSPHTALASQALSSLFTGGAYWTAEGKRTCASGSCVVRCCIPSSLPWVCLF